MKHILCFSGGKDSTAMLIHLLQHNKPIDEILYVDMGEWMWNEAKTHLQEVKTKLNVNITILNPQEEVEKGFKRWGFPSFMNRWCTGIKRDIMKQYLKNHYPNEEIIQYIGYTCDEKKRIGKQLYTYGKVEYPLVEAKINTKEALQLCYDNGFNFGGIYEHHSHFNCWLCPLQQINELEEVWKNHPNKWDKLRNMQYETDGYFYPEYSIFKLEDKFWERERERLRVNRLNARKKYNKKRNKK